jgi:hypothetical protein
MNITRRPGVNFMYKRFFAGLTAIVLLATVLTAALMLPRAQAQENPEGSFNLAITPLPLVLEAKPGTSITTEVKVNNGNSVSEQVKISVMKFGAEGEDGTPKLMDIEEGDAFAEWISFSEDKFTAEPNVWKTIKVTIDVPQSAAFGYYYAIVFSRDNAEAQIEANKANLLGAVAGLLLLDVQAPGAEREAKLVEFSTPRRMYEFLPTEFTVRMQNAGNVHVAPRGNIFISRGSSNNKISLLEVNLAKGYILPNTFRKFTSQWEDGTPVYKLQTADGKAVLNSDGKQQTFLDWSGFNLSKVRFGKYTARLVMVYNDGNRDVPVEGTVSFWVIPWRIIAGVLVVLLLVFAGLFATVIRPLKNRIKKNGK